MKKILLSLCFVCCALWIGAGAAQAESVKVPVNKITDDGVGEAIGFITFTDDGKGGLDILMDVMGISEGQHGMHVHENPSCAPAEKDGKKVAGLSAGGHFDPDKTGKHEGPVKHGHKGDLPAITADAKGEVKGELNAPNLAVKDLKGRAVIIHAGGDNYSDQPAPLGGGGARIACGVIQ
ncbi:MAG: superoxide dismutase [Cu-Zn] SodC [Desulfovibrio sp.]|uniref:superoxide dismutase [Cu-Zn] SodC n=1 Tax=Desulfovibrio sp. TaxID=885 RepID=UPI0039E40B03